MQRKRTSSVIFAAALGGSALFALASAHAEGGATKVLEESALQAPLSNLTIGSSSSRTAGDFFVGANLKGWDHVAHLLVKSGVAPAKVRTALTDPRMPPRGDLFFSLDPKESRYPYRKLNSAKNRKHAFVCYQANKSAFEGAEKQYGVPASVILSIIQVETACGKNTGRTSVFPQLLRLAAAATPENIEANVIQKRGEPKARARVETRAKWLEETFLPHAAAVLKLASGKQDFLDVKGSSAGAVGIPQFLPGHQFKYGIDGNKDGVVDLHNHADAIYSVGKYLSSHGWNQPNLPLKNRRAVIWEYNRSQPYVDTVLSMAAALDGNIKGAPIKSNRASARKTSKSAKKK